MMRCIAKTSICCFLYSIQIANAKQCKVTTKMNIIKSKKMVQRHAIEYFVENINVGKHLKIIQRRYGCRSSWSFIIVIETVLFISVKMKYDILKVLSTLDLHWKRKLHIPRTYHTTLVLWHKSGCNREHWDFITPSKYF